MKPSAFLAVACLGALFAVSPCAHAVVYDLTTNSTVAVATTKGTAIFTTDFAQTGGAGVVNPFLSIQASGVEKGYNTTASGGVLDAKQAIREVRVSDLVKVTIDGAQYYSFLLDVNEPNSGGRSEISLDSLKIFTSSTAGKSTTNIDSLGTKRFDLDLPTDNYILYDNADGTSGQADIAFFIPVSAFSGANQNDYVYMYQLFGQHVSANYDTSGNGFEQTALGAAQPVPEVAAFFPLAGVLGLAIGANHFRRRKAAAAV